MPYPFGRRPLVGVVHLAPLPGSPRAAADLRAVAARAERDAEAWLRGGADGLIVENFGDAPFPPDHVEPQVVAMMSVIASRLVGKVPVGINVLRNDARAALAVALASGASFIRVNVHTGAMETDQGIIEGRADETLRYRRSVGSKAAIFADVYVKHAAPLLRASPGRAAADAVHRGMADALLITGTATGAAADPDLLAEVASAVDVPVLIASGVTPDNAADYRRADGFIVGTFAKRAGRVDVKRVKALKAAIRKL